jgi:hypothetical protein
VAGVALFNLSSVPAVMLPLPHLQGDAARVTLALVITLAGNLLHRQPDRPWARRATAG